MTTTIEPTAEQIEEAHQAEQDADATATIDVDEVEEPETGVEIERWEQPPGATLLPSVGTWSQIQAIARDLASAVSLSPALRNKPADVALLLLTGRDVGVAPSVALNKIYVIEGKPSMAPELMRALIIDRGHFFRVTTTPTSATARYRRKEWPEGEMGEVTFTLADAKRAKLILDWTGDGDVTPAEKKTVWRSYTRSMLSARATSEAGRLDFPDVLAGVSYVPEELDADVDADGRPLVVEALPPTAPSTAPTAPVAPDASPETCQRFLDEIANDLTDDERVVLARLWKERQIGALIPGKATRPFRVNEQTAAKQAIADAKKEAVADAEIVPADNDDADTAPFVPSPGTVPLPASDATPPCETDPADPPPDPPPPDPVDVIRAEVEAMTSDAVYAALLADGLSGNGAPKALRNRLIAYRVQQLAVGT